MAEKKTTAKTTAKKKAAASKKAVAKKTPAKKAAPKKMAAPKTVEPKTSSNEKGVHPTSFAEVSRIHRGALANMKGSVVVTSSRAREGASLLTHLMAQRSAESGSKVLLIDLNLRNMELTKAFGVEAKPWHLAARGEKDDLTDLVQPAEGFPKLSFMPAPNDMESILFLKDVDRVRTLFKRLEKKYDHIIVDTTPVVALNRGNVDPMLLAAAASRTVLVMLAGVTPRRVVARTVDQLKDVGAKLAGVVVNDRENPSLKRQLLSFVNGFGRVAPGLSDWLRHKITNHRYLD